MDWEDYNYLVWCKWFFCGVGRIDDFVVGLIGKIRYKGIVINFIVC